jgi:hypothetical protein
VVSPRSGLQRPRAAACSLSANQPGTVAHISDPPHTPNATHLRVPKQRFCPDTEAVIASLNVTET